MQGLNTLVLTLRKGKTVGGAIELVKKAQAQGWGVVVAAETEAGETDDTFIAHFAVGARRGARALGDEAEPVVPSLSPSFPSRRPLSLPSGRRARGPVQGRRARVYGACLQIQRDRAHRERPQESPDVGRQLVPESRELSARCAFAFCAPPPFASAWDGVGRRGGRERAGRRVSGSSWEMGGLSPRCLSEPITRQRAARSSARRAKSPRNATLSSRGYS